MSPQPTFTPKPRDPCGICCLEPIAQDAYHVMWCLTCQEEFLATPEPRDMDIWIARKRSLAAFELQLRSACTGCYPQDNLTQRQLCKCTCHNYKWIQENHLGVTLP